MARIISAPGKTFLLGEYLALVGGPSLLVATRPRFTLIADDRSSITEVSHPFAPASPAGQFIRRNERDFRDYHLHFEDPHSGRGGLGASSAQWALLYALKNGVDFDRASWESVIEEYRQCAWNGEGVAPSGADVVAQFSGGITWYDGVSFQAREMQWDFADLSFTLIRTGTKLATHEHLKRHQAAPHETLRAAVVDATNAMEKNDEDRFVLSVERFSQALANSGRTAPATSLLLDLLKKESWVRAAKGCGAMGADVILVLHAAKDRANAVKWADARGLVTCGGLDELDRGIRRNPLGDVR